MGGKVGIAKEGKDASGLKKMGGPTKRSAKWWIGRGGMGQFQTLENMEGIMVGLVARRKGDGRGLSRGLLSWK